MKTKIDIISGFLGAGKTTFIKKMISHSFYDNKVVIIENEFGEIGIDGGLIKDSGLEIKEINSGCICCSLVGDFEKSIGEIIEEFNPDRIIIEPSGVGKLSEIIRACKTDKLNDFIQINMLLTVVDVERFNLYIQNFGEFFEDQIKNAKTILLSRTQNASQEKVESVVGEIQKVNSRCNIVTTPWENLMINDIVDLAEQRSINPTIIGVRTVKNVKRKSKKVYSPTVFESWGMETPKRFSESKLKDVLEEFKDNKDFGNILRCKGIVQTEDNKWIQFNYIPGNVEIKEIAPNYTGKLSIIGTGLNKESLKKIFDNIL